LLESGHTRLSVRITFGEGHLHADAAHLRGLLCARRERPHHRRAAE
jgi:hypothetical protein